MITSPTLLVDEQKCRDNIQRMVKKASRHDLTIKPHFKTHQSADIGEWFREEGVHGITVSSVKMADYFHRHGWEEITIAFPVNPREMEHINRLAEEIDLTLLISDSDSVQKLQDQLSAPVKVLIEADTGSGRTGFKPAKAEQLDQVVNLVQGRKNMRLNGFYSHPGHSYSARSRNEIQSIYAGVLAQCTNLRKRYASSIEDLMICIGDTPCCSIAEKFEPIDQISPGNFVFYDVMQTRIGSCAMGDIAVALACPVVAKYPSRNEIAIHGGAIHLSKEKLETDAGTHFGLPVLLDNNMKWSDPLEDSFVTAISQEHGIIKCGDRAFSSLQIGDLVGILPVHSCLTADLMAGYRTLNGNRLNHIRNQ